ncbi:Wzz/FepE/Etk N-terminal domain-containing protein [Photobacterium sp. SDRW27]|uniref:GumC family protein n=1 Tax=Photobacterium obscurum TaxID=2829490 RepID=UPI002244D08A|nr:Wzz/FepE/Etk N-terminal domain-containing protein [Photobacterium obscurum]MCW8332052.1 Wzz/FepE/Etk N-terminal domain-containing protein [Photobacterium obscurum]
MRHKLFAKLYPLLHAMWNHRYLILIPVLVMPLLMTAGSFVKAKRYYAQTTILVQEAAMLNPFLEDLSISMNLKDRIKALRVLIHSHSVLEQVVEELDLAPTNNRSQVEAVIGNLNRNLALTLVGNDLVQLGLNWPAPTEMPAILNKVSEIFLDKLRAPGRASIDGSEIFLQKQLESTQQDLEQAESELAAFKTENADNLPQLQNIKVQSDARLNILIQETELKLLHAQTQRDNFYQRLASTNPVVGMLEEEIVKAEAELAMLRASYTDRHSSVKGVLRRLDRLKKERTRLVDEQQSLSAQEVSQLWQRVASNSQNNNNTTQPILLSQFEKLQQAEGQILALTDELTLLQGQATLLQNKRAEFAVLEKQLKILQRNYDVKSRIYNQLLERYEMAKVTGHLGRFEEPDRLKIIDRPVEPHRPLNWPWWLNFIIGIAAGLGLGLSLACAVQLLDTRLYQTTQINRLTQVPVLTRLPNFSGSAS